MSIKAALEFVHAINSHDVKRIAHLMTEDHVFIDSRGNKMNGSKQMSSGWVAYFKMCPDYKIDIEETIEKGNLVALFGRTSGTYILENIPDGIYWECTAAWKAVVENGKTKLWQVYADWSSFYEQINKSN